MATRARRVLAISAVATAILAAALLVVAHTSFVRTRVLQWVVGLLESRYDLVLATEDLSYNLLTGSATLRGVRLAARGHEADPFFTAAHVYADVPLGTYLGAFALDDVNVRDGRIRILTDAAGESNLPGGESDDDPPAEARTLPIHGLVLEDLDFEYDNAETGVRIAAAGIAADLADRPAPDVSGINGPLTIRGGIDLRFGERALAVAPIDARIGFDGSTVSLLDLPLSTPLLQASVAGRIDRVLDAPSLDLVFDGRANLAEAAAWGPSPVAVAGTARVKGSITGAVAEAVSTVRFDGSGLTVGDETDLTASGEITVDASGLAGQRVHLTPASGGRVDATFTVPFDTAPVTAAAQWQALDARVLIRLAEQADQAIGTRLDGEMTFTGGDTRAAVIETTATALPARGLAPLDGRITARVNGAAWTLVHDLRVPGLAATGTASGRLVDEDITRTTIGGPLHVVITSLESAAASLAPLGLSLPDAVRDLEGRIEADGTVAGTLGDPSTTMSVIAPGLMVPAVGETAVAVSIAADSRRVHVSPIAMTRGTTTVSGRLDVDLRTRAIDGAIDAESPDVRELQAEVPEEWQATGPLTVRTIIQGSMDEPRVHVTLDSPGLLFADKPLDIVEGEADITESGVEITALTVGQGDGRIRATGRYGFDRSYTVNLNVADLAWEGRVVGETESRVVASGSFTGTGTLDEPAGHGHFTFDVTGGPAGEVVESGVADIALLGDHARVTAHVPQLGAFANGVVGLAAPYDYRAVAVLNRLDVAGLLPLLEGRVTDVTGEMTLTASARGAISGEAAPVVDANLQSVQASIAGVPLVLAAPAPITWRSGAITVREFVAVLGTSTITAYGTWAGRTGSAYSGTFLGEVSEVMTAARAFGVDTGIVASGPVAVDVFSDGTTEGTIASLDVSGGRVEMPGGLIFTNLNVNAGINRDVLSLHTFNSSVAAAKLSGAFSAAGTATIPGLDPLQTAGTFTINEAAFDTAGVAVTQTRPSTFSVADRVLTLDDVQWEAEGSTLTVAGEVDLKTESPSLDLTTKGTAVLRVLSAFLPALGFDGTADVDVGVTGTVAVPSLAGSIELQSAEIALPSPRVVISELTGPIRLDANRVELRGLTGSANGGALVIDGGLQLDGTAIGVGEIYVQAQGMAVEYPPGLRSEIDALLTYDIAGETPRLSGDVRVLRSGYTEPISLAALARGNNSSAPRPAAARSALDDLRLNIFVTTVEDLSVDNNYGRFEGGAALRLVGTASEPGMTGQVTLREGGTIYAAGRTFTLNRGTISFSNLAQIEPDLDIEAQTRVSSGSVGDVTLRVQGTPSRLTTDLTSSEGAGREDIAEALFGGGAAGANALVLLSGDLLGATGRQLGLDTLRLDRENVAADDIRADPSVLAGDEDPTTRLTLSRRIRDNVEFTVSQNLRESGKATFIVSYFARRNLEFRALSRDNADYGIGLRHMIQFGGVPAASAGAAIASPEVASVSFEGDLAPLTEADLRRLVRIEPGERFDFHDWQQDQDRLSRAYVDRDHLEIRVRGRRVEREDGRIDVVFELRPGPSTRLVVNGLTLSGREMEGIREAWTRAVFDRFLIDDAEARVRRHLLADGYVEGEVRGSVETAGDVKTLRLDVNPGTRASGREIRFSGNAAVTESRLRTAVARSGLDVDAWIEPQGLADALTAFYRDEGYFEAQITVQAPRLEGTTGVLPVTVVEGPQGVIGEVTLSGVAPEREEETRTALGITTPTPYSAAAVEGARQRVEQRYRRNGFNTVEVRTASEGEGVGPFTLAVTVAEGPQEVLQEVVTAGDTRTRPGVIDQALRLRLGQPVNLEEWAAARKRLYDTNVFRVVDIEPVPMGEAVDGVQPVRARVTVEEYAPWRLRYGLQFDRERIDLEEDGELDNNIGAIVDVRNQNLFGRALTGGVAARVERDYFNGTLFFSRPSFFSLPVRSNLFSYSTRENLRIGGEVAAVVEEIGVSYEQRWRLRGIEVSYGYRYERNVTTIPDLPAIDQPSPINLGRLSSAIVWDRRNNPLDASRGTFSAFSWDQGAGWLRSDARYGKVLAQQQVFVPLGPVVLAWRGLIGDVFGQTPGEVIRADRFLAGGSTTVRGYAENTLGPRDIFGIARGGEQMIVLNQEARFPLYRWFRGVGFLDAGNVFGDLDDDRSRTLNLGYGMGIRIDSPIGVLRLDYGIPASTLAGSRRQGNSFSGGRWYFGFGNIF